MCFLRPSNCPQRPTGASGKGGGTAIKNHRISIVLGICLAAASVCSLFVGVIDLDLPSLFGGDMEQLKILVVSRLPRLLAILCTGVGMSVAGLIMQQLCMNKFVSPTTGARPSPRRSSAFCWRFCSCRIPRSGGGRCSPLPQRRWARGSSCGSSSASPSRTW